MIVAAGLAISTAVVIFFFLVPEPELLEIVVEEYTEKEALIDTA
jgi:hypothetical protein